MNNNNTFDIDVTVVLNEEKNGIELHFNDKPSEEIRNLLKSNNFKWSRYNKCWFAKQNDKTISFANSLTDTTMEEIKDKSNEYKEQKQINIKNKLAEIDIDDIESYIVPAQISKRENENAFFRNTETDHTKCLQNELIYFNKLVMNTLQNNTNLEIEHYLKSALQRFKKNYTEAYIKYLNHKGNNPSWLITGRGGRNSTKDKKINDKQHKLMMNTIDLKDNFYEKCKNTKYKIQKEKELKEKKEFEEGTKNIMIPKFKRIKKNINTSAIDNIFDGNTTFAMTMHEYDNFFILKNWGTWRIYFKSGVELYSTKTTETLEDAKKWLIYYLQKNAKKEA
ncbi:hypothetical protein IR152_15945 [Clostridioides sp. ES-S-0108-01]|uniref:hypothetical protein n=1 Tax=unclassified Clostridioides TaxID=2635829 RepID=UPI001D0C4C2F|nr:hypothetical protein [Clostridioides sp. ES-S-0107-01]MCC0784527.1 hypothetical protein [Clostridioides sp. ES-S-0108-01]UDN53079.1 hypothetical protein JJC16_19105 [Clostridioides sp. ES-S-0107-01]